VLKLQDFDENNRLMGKIVVQSKSSDL